MILTLRNFVTASVLLVISIAVGCRAPRSATVAKTQVSAMSPENLAVSNTAKPVVAVDETPEKTEEAALAEVLDELTEVGAIDPTAKSLLMADLRAAKRENWPMIVRQFRSALAYRKQLAEREQEATNEQLTVEKPTKKTTELVVAKQTTTRLAFASPTEVATQAVPVSFDIQETDPRDPRDQQTVEIYPVAQPNVPQPNPVAPEPIQVLPQPPQQLAQQVSHVTNVELPHDWQGQLQSAIAGLQASVQPIPGSTDEVHEHMRLRLLQLLAGDEEAALGPIPGATAAQQDYWNKQLFAVSTFLDSSRQPDNKRRAAGSLMHLDQARAKLAELATMQVRKLAFVDSVAGYGAYELHEAAKFRPGDQVTLYAEIENFSSESTKDGYRTQLGTSYEVIDTNGKRVDSAQFPEVEDLCRNPRRDFHMQYTVTLPTRIYPEHYELRLIITDQQSQKIGQASVPFEITE